MSVFGSLLGGLARSIALGQVRAALPAVGGGLAVLGVKGQVDPTQFEGAVYYLISSAFVIVPALWSYLQKRSMAQLVQDAIVAAPGTAEAAAIQAKVS